MGYMNKKQMFLVKDGVDALCEETRGIAVPCVDAFGFTDLILRSPLGEPRAPARPSTVFCHLAHNAAAPWFRVPCDSVT
jgi:hypothetical protein